MGGKSKSSTSTASTVEDRRIAADNGAIVITEGAQVDFLSDDALSEVLDFAGEAGTKSYNLVESVVTKALNTFVTTQGRAFDSALDSTAKAYGQTALALEAQRSEGLQGFKQFLIAGVGIAALVSAAYVFKGKVKL